MTARTSSLGHIVAMGSGALLSRDSAVEEFLLDLAGSKRPSVCYVGTASAHVPERVGAFYDAFGERDCEPSHLELFGMPEEPAAHIARQDVIYVGGGSMLRPIGRDILLNEQEAMRAISLSLCLCSGAPHPLMGVFAAHPPR